MTLLCSYLFYNVDHSYIWGNFMRKKSLLGNLSKEQIQKAKACNNSKELLELAKAEGVELTKEQLAAIKGGNCSDFFESPECCPECGSKNIEYYWGGNLRCKDCGCVFPE